VCGARATAPRSPSSTWTIPSDFADNRTSKDDASVAPSDIRPQLAERPKTQRIRSR
jgi:hypothetical protein